MTNELGSPDVPVDDPWEITVVARQNKPPLRFKGQRIARVSCALTPHADIFIDVWLRKKGDCVVAYSDVVGGVIKPDALVLADISDVADYLEDLGRRTMIPMSQSAFPAALNDILQSVGFQRQFGILIGDLLAVLDPLCAPDLTIASDSEV
ncbi:hypothetical protein MWU60_00900 [Yoonia sp. F2084L]|uniref:hypothetical protein n=1 Tax=Yoonia sp. F2084L TaxID=2926419 RepID=UPI001FF4B398|nr:hypothetical protein [Yoonia sp. F2084L]MCK0094112.1 hypothetical protein [Yoonia sp. F2084L]